MPPIDGDADADADDINNDDGFLLLHRVAPVQSTAFLHFISSQSKSVSCSNTHTKKNHNTKTK